MRQRGRLEVGHAELEVGVERRRRRARSAPRRSRRGTTPTARRTSSASAVGRLPHLELVAEVEVRARDLPGLQDGEAPAGPAPLDVLREAVVVLDPLADARTARGPARRAGPGPRGGRRGPATVGRTLARRIGRGHHELVVDLAVDDLERRLGDDELVGVHLAGHDRLAEAPARVQEELERVRRHRVGGEQHAGRPRTGTSPARRRPGSTDSWAKPWRVAVGDGPAGPQRRPAAPAPRRPRPPRPAMWR